MSQPSFLPRRSDVTQLVLHYEDADWALTSPALYQLLCHAKAQDGRFRAGARLTLFCEDGRLKASIWDPDTHQVYFVTLQAWETALRDLEAHLQSGGGEWRVKKENGSTGRR